MTERFLYLFLDEGGNLDFSSRGTKYFTMTCLTKERPFCAYKALCDLKYDLIQQGVEIQYFHATEDRQEVRNSVFEIIRTHLKDVTVDAVIVEKAKTGPALRPVERFYPKMLGYLVRHVLGRVKISDFTEVLVFTDSIPVEKKKQSVQKAIKEVFSDMLPAEVKYRIFHHSSKSSFDLQIVDYCNWAIYRKWEIGDFRSIEVIKPVIKSEFDIFRRGVTLYY